MVKQIFVNLPVADLKKVVAVFTKLGFKFDPQFTDENAACMIIGENMYAMLLVNAMFKTFSPKEICDTKKSTEVLVALALESRTEVDKMVRNAIEAGGNNLQGTARPRLHVRPRFPGFGWPHLGTFLHGIKRSDLKVHRKREGENNERSTGTGWH